MTTARQTIKWANRMIYDLFVSYSRLDNRQDEVVRFLDGLKHRFLARMRRPLVVFFDTTEVTCLDDWRDRLLPYLRDSRALLALISPAYNDCAHCEWEFNEFAKQEIGCAAADDGVAPIYAKDIPDSLARDFGKQDAPWLVELRRRHWFDFRSWFAERPTAIEDASHQSRIDELVDSLADRIRRDERFQSRRGNINAGSPHFVGRGPQLRLLHEAVIGNRVGVLAVVHGLGGMGKTALATQYAHVFAHEYGGGRWYISCKHVNSLSSAMIELSSHLGVVFSSSEQRHAGAQLTRILDELRRLADLHEPHRCLLLLDDIREPAILEPAQTQRLPLSDWLHVIVTTTLGKDHLFGRHNDRVFIPLDELREEDALALIESYQPDGSFRSDAERAAARDIARLLNGFTLAVESAAVFLGEFAGDVTCSAFLDRLRREGLEGLDNAATEGNERVRHGERRVRATLQPTLERLTDQEALILIYCALLPSDQIALPWVRVLVSEHFPHVSNNVGLGYPDPWQQALRRLLSLRLLQTVSTTEAAGEVRLVRMHNIVQQAILLHFDPPAIRAEKLMGYVSDRGVFVRRSWLNLSVRWELEPLLACAARWLEEGKPAGALVVSAIEQPLRLLGRFRAAEPLLLRSLVVAESHFGADSEQCASCLSNLALTLKNMERYEEAEELYRRALAITRKLEHTDIHQLIVIHQNLGSLLSVRGQLAEAELLLRRAISLGNAIPEPREPFIVEAMFNLSYVLKETKQFEEAEELLHRAIAINQDVHGDEDPRLAHCYIDLGALYEAQDRLSEAEEAYRTALEIGRKGVGGVSPAVEAALFGLYLIARGHGDVREAEAYLREAIGIAVELNGATSPSVARKHFALGDLLDQLGRLDEAATAFHDALKADEGAFGTEHPELVIDLASLGEVLRRMGRLDDAEPILRRALDLIERVCNSVHDKYYSVLNNLALVRGETGGVEEAEALLWRALGVAESAHSVDLRETGTILGNLGDIHLRTGEFTEAETLLHRAVSCFRSISQLQHPHALRAQLNLAVALCARGRPRDAVPIARAVFISLTAIGQRNGHEHADFRLAAFIYSGSLRSCGFNDRSVESKVKAAVDAGVERGKRHKSR